MNNEEGEKVINAKFEYWEEGRLTTTSGQTNVKVPCGGESEPDKPGKTLMFFFKDRNIHNRISINISSLETLMDLSIT